LNLGEHVVNGAVFRPAFVVCEVSLKLLFGFIGVEQKFLAGAESQVAEVAIRRARRRAYESHDNELAIGHRSIMAGRLMCSQIDAVLLS
jgi:hypothetical protein